MIKEKLIEELIEEGYLKTPVIIDAFKDIDRADFIAEEQIDLAYINQPLSIGENQTISQPLTVAFMLELLEPKSGDRILDIGTGSGWQAALLANIISKNDKNKSGKVITIERIEKLKVIAEENFKKYNFLKKEVIETVLGDATKGYKPEAPYDKIVVAAAGYKIPEAWKKQLKVGGRIVAPVESSIYVYNKISEEEFEKKQYFGFSFVPLVKGVVRGYNKES